MLKFSKENKHTHTFKKEKISNNKNFVTENKESIGIFRDGFIL
jgi:hypothetical protein